MKEEESEHTLVSYEHEEQNRKKRIDLQSTFHLLTAKPDSVIKAFYQKIRIDKNDILDLCMHVSEKLKTHDIDALTSSVDYYFSDNYTEQYSSFAAFENDPLQISKITESISLKWDFLLKIKGFEVPQRHTLIVKISTSVRPIQFMQALFSKDPDEMDKYEIDIAPVIARTDFISHSISQELIKNVDDWVISRPQNLEHSGIFKFIVRYQKAISNIISYSMPLSILIVGISYLDYLFSDQNALITPLLLRNSLLWLLLSLTGIFSFWKFGLHLTNKFERQILYLSSRVAIFNVTRGDKNNIEKLIKQNRKSFWKIFLSITSSILIDLISATVVYLLNGR
ncbi:hypothetical protein EHQ76_09115 [Leptospira barantonii]|uniref:Uncharacterized protein n=1 Tax=Leptospira barantonii TaxID=2023184 RepID=A0A5F2BDZ2_9LEPT|nr:hypothetical protein [Leptospira barantonii]TGM03793.1 hypothetical protein EHQ76_09115 [Leptospira barantonii]